MIYHLKRKEVMDLLDRIPTEDLKDILTDYVIKDDSLRNKLELKYTEQLNAKQIRALKEEIKGIVTNNSVRGFVNWENAPDFVFELNQFLNQKVQLLIERNDLQHAFELTNDVFHCIGTVDMDDSDGGSTSVADNCYECWKLILKKADGKLKSKMKEWFQKHQKAYVVDFMEEYIDEFLMSEFVSEEVLREKIHSLDELLTYDPETHKCPDIYSVHYGYENAVDKRIEYMRKLGCTEEEIQEFCVMNRRYFIVREKEIAMALAVGDEKKAIQLLLESKEMDQQYPAQMKKYSRQLIDLYKKHAAKRNISRS